MHLFNIATIFVVLTLVGVEFSVSAFVNPAAWRLDPEPQLKMLARCAFVGGRVMPVWYPICAVLLGLQTWLHWRASGREVLLAADAIWVAVSVTSIFVLVPLNNREITWPGVEIYAAKVPRAPRDLVLLDGPEPSMRWRTFSQLIVDLAEALGVQLVVSLGALLADVPHSHPVTVTGLSSDPGLIERLDLSIGNYEGPTGIVGVLHAACSDSGLPSASLWASVPHYVAAAPNPKAALALVRRLEGLVGVSVDASQLESAAADYERQVALAVQSDPDVQAFVERLERMAEDEQSSDPEDVPSGDIIAREFQRFLRQRGTPPSTG